MSNTPVNGQTAGQPSYAELLARIQQLETQASQPKGVEFTLADKGGISANGTGRFPTTLYAEQWLKLIDAIETQGLRMRIYTWLSKGERLLKGVKDETAASILQRSITFGVTEIGKRTAASVPASVPAVPTVATPPAK